MTDGSLSVLSAKLNEDSRWRRRAKFFGFGGCGCCTAQPSGQYYYSPAIAGQTYHVFGGTNNVAQLSSNLQWVGAWITKTAMTVGRSKHSGSTPSSGGPAYVYCGDDNANFPTSRSDSYTPDAWSTNTAAPTKKSWASSGCAISGKCYAFGGSTNEITNAVTNENAEMTPGSPSTWAAKATMPIGTFIAGATYIGLKGYSVCGVKNTGSLVDVTTNYEYTPAGDSWATKTAYPSTARTQMSAWTLSGIAYFSDGGPNLVPTLRGYVVDSWTTYATPPTAVATSGFSPQYSVGASVEGSGVAWETGGINPPPATGWSRLHSEYVPNAWATRTVFPNVNGVGEGSACPA